MDSEIYFRLQDSISSGEFPKATALWEIHAAQVADEIRGGICSQARLTQMRELIDWTRGIVTCTRAHAQRRVNVRRTELHAAAVYGRPLR